MDKFILIDETLVSHGYWVKVSGIDLVQFKRNPVMYWMHQRPQSWSGKDQMLPIGRWEDIKVETIDGNKSITAIPIFDEKDEFAMKIKSKVEGGFVKMASAGLRPLTWSSDAAELKPGQTRETVIASEMVEASIVDIGANNNAIRLYDESGLIELSAFNNIHQLQIKQEYIMKQIALKLGLAENATESEIITTISNLQASEKSAVEKLNSHNEAKKTALLVSIADFDKDVKDSIEKLADIDISSAEKLAVQILKKEVKEEKGERISDFIEQSASKASSTKNWTDYSEKELIELRQKNTAVYIGLYEKEFGTKPTLE